MDIKYIPGDLCIVKGKVESVCEVDRDNDFSITTDQHPFIRLSEVKPIPLTPKILEKNGWRTQNRWYYYLDVAEGFISYIGIDFKHKSNKGHLYVEVDGNNMVEIQYCHELQHLLFGLGINHEMEV